MPGRIKIIELHDFKGSWTMEYGCVPTKFGDVQLGALNGTVCFLYFAPSSQLKTNVELAKKRFPKVNFKENDISTKKLADKIFLNENSDIEVLLSGTEFQNCVWRTLLKIPIGVTWTYSDCAERIGKSSAVRAVANAIAKNEIAFLIPCHRVVSKNGNKLKYGWGAEYKSRLLKYEGAM